MNFQFFYIILKELTILYYFNTGQIHHTYWITFAEISSMRIVCLLNPCFDVMTWLIVDNQQFLFWCGHETFFHHYIWSVMTSANNITSRISGFLERSFLYWTLWLDKTINEEVALILQEVVLRWSKCSICSLIKVIR